MSETTDTTEKTGTVNLLEVITVGRQLPEGYDGWLIRTVRPDFTSSNGYRYPFPGAVAEAPGPMLDHPGACPRSVGDGICAATTWEGMADGGVPARTLLLVAYKSGDVLGGGDRKGKLRLRQFLIVDVIDGEALLVEQGNGADLTGAYLNGANLSRAYLNGANLSRANLNGARLYGARLNGANLSRAYLNGANLTGANLNGANLNGADLYGALGVVLPKGWRTTDSGFVVPE